MKMKDVKLGSVYTMKVSGSLTKVRVTQDLGEYTTWKSPSGMSQFRRPVSKHRGWSGINLKTGRSVHIRTAARLRAEIPAHGAANDTFYVLTFKDGMKRMSVRLFNSWLETKHVVAGHDFASRLAQFNEMLAERSMPEATDWEMVDRGGAA